jgi:hypothetical protein
MADRAPRQTVPADINPLDEAVYEPGTPTSSWLGREVGENLRWLDSHLTRRFGECWPTNIDNLDTPTIRNAGGEAVGPYTHWGTPGVRRGEWYFRASFAAGAELYVTPFAISPELYPTHVALDDGSDGSQIFVGTGAEENYGPISSPLREGPNRIGLLFSPPLEAANDATGTVAWADGRQLCSAQTVPGTGDFAGYSAAGPPLPVICLYDGSGQLCEWTQILDIRQTVVADDTVSCQYPLTQRGQVYGAAKGAVSWATRFAVPVTMLSVYFRELRP